MRGELPGGWVWARLGDICDINPRHHDIQPNDDDEVSFVPMAAVEVETGKLDPSATRIYADVRKKSLTHFQEGDVLFSKITPCMENGKIALAENLHGGRAVGSTEFIVFRCSSVLESNFLLNFLLQSVFRREAELNMAGAVGQRRVPKFFVENYPIPLPSVVEQRRIVTALEEQLSRLGSVNSTLRAAEARAALMRESALRAELGKVSVKIFPLSDVLAEKIINGRSVQTREAGFPVLRLNAIQDGRIDLSASKEGAWTAEEAQPYLVHSGDFLLSRGNGTLSLVGRGGIVPERVVDVAFPDTMMRIRVNPEFVDTAYFELIWNSRRVRSQIESAARTTAGIYKVNQSILREIELPIPSLDDQRAIVARVHGLSSGVSRLQDALVTTQKHSVALRHSLLSAAFSGRLVPQDSSDEPASVLLERIRAERAAAPAPKRGRRASTPKAPKPAPDPQPVPAGEQTSLEF